MDPVGGPLSWNEPGHLVLVPAARPADALWALGPSEYNDRPGPSVSVAVLRSWEDRYGAVPLRFSHDCLTVGLRRPPRTYDEGRAAVIEMLAFCSDAFDTSDLEETFGSMIGERLWDFWWD